MVQTLPSYQFNVYPLIIVKRGIALALLSKSELNFFTYFPPKLPNTDLLKLFETFMCIPAM